HVDRRRGGGRPALPHGRARPLAGHEPGGGHQPHAAGARGGAGGRPRRRPPHQRPARQDRQADLMTEHSALATSSREDLVARAEAWLAADVDERDVAELRALVDATADPHAGEAALAELRDRFAGPLQFGTAGLRGAMAAGPNRMNRAVVVAAAAGLGAFLADELEGTPRVVVGFDARYRSADFA